MTAFAIVLIVLGVLAALVGGIMMLVAAFRQSVWWGLAYLFVPMASLVFLFIHWAEAKKGFLINLAGVVLLVGGALSMAPVRDAIAGKSSFEWLVPAANGKPAAAKDLTAQIQEAREHIEQIESRFAQTGAALTKQYQELNARRTALKPADAAGNAQFNADLAVYQAGNAGQRQLQQEITTAHQALNELLAKRSSAAAVAAPSAKRVVMFTTSTCPACRSAKEYFAKKGVSYDERDVNGSPAAREEFQRLGGRGVPLIMVGNEKMEGFNAQRLEQLL